MAKWSDFTGMKRSVPLAVLAAALAAMPQVAHAQQGGGADPGIGQGQSQGEGDRSGGRSGGLANGRRAVVIPYLEVGQVLSADLKNGGDLLTYSLAAVGVDAAVATSRAEAQVSVRYERRFSWNDDFGDEDAISGVARGNVQIIPNTLSLEAGALGVRSRVDNRGAAPSNLIGGSDNVTQIYSVYAGPTLATQVGTVDVNALYRIGYTKVEADTVALPAASARSTCSTTASTMPRASPSASCRAASCRSAGRSAAAGIARMRASSTSASTTGSSAPMSPFRSARRSRWSAAWVMRISRFRSATRCVMLPARPWSVATDGSSPTRRRRACCPTIRTA